MKTRWMIFAALVASCDKGPEVQVLPPVDEPVFDDTFTTADPADKGPAVLDPADADGKIARRVSVEQLRRSIPALFGGITWTIRSGRTEQNAFDVLSRTLGEPDYIAVNTENRDPSPLFAKYMDDMAGDVCGKAIAADQAGSGEKLVMVKADIDENLRFLRLKLHGIYVPDDSMDGLGDLRRLYDDTFAGTNDAATAWYSVCVAMLTAPELMAY